MKRKPTEKEKIFANPLSYKGLLSKLYKKLTDSMTKQNLIQKWEKELNRLFFQRRHPNGSELHEKVSTSLIIRKMKVKTTKRYHLTLDRIAVIQKTKDNTYW